MNYRKFRKNLKAISPIISVLLMIAIAVVASLVVYAWVMGYIGYQTGKTGDSVVIQSVSWALIPLLLVVCWYKSHSYLLTKHWKYNGHSSL